MPQKGENIRKRKDGRWEGRYIKGYDSQTRKAKYASIYGKTYSEVRQLLNEAKYKTSIGYVHLKGTNKVFGEIVICWFDLQKSILKPASIVKYHNLIEHHILPELGHLKIRDVNADNLNLFFLRKSTGSPYNNEVLLKSSTLQSLLYIINASIAYAAGANLMPPFSMNLPASASGTNSVTALSPSEETRLDMYLSSHQSTRNLGIAFSLYCGLRLGEVCGLKWSDIDFEQNVLYVRRTVQRLHNLNHDTSAKTALHIGPPKTVSSKRTIPIPLFLIPVIRESFQTRENHCYILNGSDSRPMEPRTLQYHFKRILAECDVKDTNYHTLRHTFATNCILLGFDVKTLSEILGHSNVNITLNKYVHPSIQRKETQMNYWNSFKGQNYGHHTLTE